MFVYSKEATEVGDSCLERHSHLPASYALSGPWATPAGQQRKKGNGCCSHGVYRVLPVGARNTGTQGTFGNTFLCPKMDLGAHPTRGFPQRVGGHQEGGVVFPSPGGGCQSVCKASFRPSAAPGVILDPTHPFWERWCRGYSCRGDCPGVVRGPGPSAQFLHGTPAGSGTVGPGEVGAR